MLTKLRQPILAGTIGLAFTGWVLDLLSPWLGEPLRGLGILSVGAIAVGTTFWLRQKPSTVLDAQPEASAKSIQQQLAAAQQIIEQLEAEAGQIQNELRARVAQVTTELDRQDARLAVIGSGRVGKTSLAQHLAVQWVPGLQHKCSLQEMPSLFVGTVAGLAQEQVARTASLTSDLVLFVVGADLTQPEYQALEDLVAQSKRTVLVFNKRDQYLPFQQSIVLKQIQKSVEEILSAADVVAIAAAPGAVKVRQHQPDGSVEEHLEHPQPQIEPLTERLSQILAQEKDQLVLHSTLHQALALRAAAQGQLNQVRRNRALPLVEQFQWIAAATAFTNPLPTLDLLAAAAITAKMVLDLATLYQQKLSLAQAQAFAKTLAGLMLKLGLVEFSTQTLGSLLKSHSMTFVAGGAVQGVSAAYLTRLAGLSLIEHFQALSERQTSDKVSLEGLGQTLQAVFQQNQRLTFLKSLVNQALNRLRTPFPALLSVDPAVKLEENKSIACIPAVSLESTPAPST